MNKISDYFETTATTSLIKETPTYLLSPVSIFV